MSTTPPAIPTTVPTPSDCPVWCQIIIAVVVVVAVIIGGTIYLCYCCGCYCFRNTKGCYFRKKKIPEGPLENVKSDATSVTIGWKPPKDGCCLPVKHYIIERRRDVNEEDWIKVATVEAETFTCVVGNLTVGNSYMVRVFAENCCKGISEPLVSDGAVKIRNKSEVPVWPSGTLRCSEIMSDSVTLEWGTPFDNGGSPLTGYAIEAKDSKLKDWYPVADINAGVNRHVVRNLEQGEEYNFRISATNKVGRSQPVTMDTPVTVKPMVTGTNAIALKKRRPSGNNDPEKNSGGLSSIFRGPKVGQSPEPPEKKTTNSPARPLPTPKSSSKFEQNKTPRPLPELKQTPRPLPNISSKPLPPIKSNS
ncbi:twitchin isoform X1 [Patella vulgata]|uniref:twitchin isoform X1 n=1 Tax=Patella vulgata TaxID=6465 RepID=UPI0024A7C22E|nr:twitchin isoform X1 [Patella vulgata]